MRKFIFKNFVALSAVTLMVFSSCSDDKTGDLKNSTRFNMISSMDDVSFVMSIDLIELLEKSDFQNSPNVPFEAVAGYKMFVGDKINPENAGIQLSGDNHLALTMGSNGEPSTVMYTGKVVDATKVKEALKKSGIFKGKYSKEEMDGSEYEFMIDDEVAICWDATDFVVVFSQDEDAKKTAENLMLARFHDADANAGLAEYLELKDDFNMYVDIEQSMLTAKETKEGEDIKPEMLKMAADAYYVSRGNFNAGEILFDMNIHADNLKNSEYNALGTTPVKKEFLNFLTNDKLMMMGVASINMDALFNGLSLIDNKDFSLKKVSKETGLSEEEMREMFDGQFAISLVDVIQTEQSYASLYPEEDDFFEEDYTYTTEEPVMMFIAGINDSTKLGAFLRENGGTKNDSLGGFYVGPSGKVFIHLEQDKLLLSSSTDVLKDVLSANTNKSGVAAIDKMVYGKITTDPLDMPKGILAVAEKEKEGKMAIEFAGLFEKVEMNGEFEHFQFKAELKNKEQNALKVITDFAFDAAQEQGLLEF